MNNLLISYKTPVGCFDKSDKSEPFSWWLERNLGEPGIEKKLDKLILLVTILTERHIRDNPQDLQDVVDAVKCEAFDHKLIEEE